MGIQLSCQKAVTPVAAVTGRAIGLRAARHRWAVAASFAIEVSYLVRSVQLNRSNPLIRLTDR